MLGSISPQRLLPSSFLACPEIALSFPSNIRSYLASEFFLLLKINLNYGMTTSSLSSLFQPRGLLNSVPAVCWLVHFLKTGL